MWTYYGTKKHLAKYYPVPTYDSIIEPFAGAAQYSLWGDNWKKNVHLVDKYPVIIAIWNYLIQVTPLEILVLPDMEVGDNVDNYTQLSQEEKWLIGFCINSASAAPKKTVQVRTQWNRTRQEIADNLHKIRHWTTEVGDYTSIPNKKATWFIDPPYEFGGIYYRYNNSKINYHDLGKWCLDREGQVIVCENDKATWLPFSPLTTLYGQLHKTIEVIFVKE
jgi:hypothetical protein